MIKPAVSDLPYLIDSDTGADDAMAILLAAAYAPERLRLLLATYGNYTRATTAANFATMAALGGIRLPVRLGRTKLDYDGALGALTERVRCD